MPFKSLLIKLYNIFVYILSFFIKKTWKTIGKKREIEKTKEREKNNKYQILFF